MSKSTTTGISVKLTPLELRMVDELISLFNYRSRSDVLRKGLLVLAQDNKIKPSAVADAFIERQRHKPRKRRTSDGTLTGYDAKPS